MTAFVAPLLMVVMAEMGDKTQLLAMTFAAKYRAPQVLLGVFIGSLLNHGMAVGLGSYLGELIPLDLLGIAAGFLFLLFGVLALRQDKDDDEEGQEARFGPVATVALSFFLGEMGDKTQLTTLTMAVQYTAPLMVLGGAVAGMMIANSPGILVGDKLLRKVSPRTLRLVSAAVFVGFGMVQLYETLGAGARTWAILGASAAAVGLAAGLMLRSRRQAAEASSRANEAA
ncbi:MAG TPA: TMEM165/GDT1 family protein [Symbiobacteriaceae bacterium]|nr:TMEM165/GDT1 family protein [Symbiobacteriaceae bacterium]